MALTVAFKHTFNIPDKVFRALLNMFIFLLLFERLRVLNVTIYSASVVKVSTASKSGFVRSDKNDLSLNLHCESCLKPVRLNLPRSLGFNQTSVVII